MTTSRETGTAESTSFTPSYRQEAGEKVEADRETPVQYADIDFNVRAEQGLLTGKQLTSHVAMYNSKHEAEEGELAALIDKTRRTPAEEERVREIVISGSQDAFEALNALEANGVDTENSRVLYGIEMVHLIDGRIRPNDPEGQAYPDDLKAITGQDDDPFAEQITDEEDDDPTDQDAVQSLRRRRGGRGPKTENEVTDAIKHIALSLAGAEVLDLAATSWTDNPVTSAMETALEASEETEHISAGDTAKLVETYGHANNMEGQLADSPTDTNSLNDGRDPRGDDNRFTSDQAINKPDETVEGHTGFNEGTRQDEA